MGHIFTHITRVTNTLVRLILSVSLVFQLIYLDNPETLSYFSTINQIYPPNETSSLSESFTKGIAFSTFSGPIVGMAAKIVCSI